MDLFYSYLSLAALAGFAALFGVLLLPRQFPECFALFLQK